MAEPVTAFVGVLVCCAAIVVIIDAGKITLTRLGGIVLAVMIALYLLVRFVIWAIHTPIPFGHFW
jgi:hypothetical protein